MKQALVLLFGGILVSVSGCAKELDVPLKKGQQYEDVKPALLKAGWAPVEFKDTIHELPEIQYCQQGGEGLCGIWLTAGEDKYLSITTTNDGYMILEWRRADSLPKE